MNDKIKKLSTKLVGLFPQKEFLEPQEAFTSFSDVYIPQKDYFGNFSPEDIIKLVIYIYSYKNTKDFDYGDKILNNLAFSDLLLITDENYTATCNECNGYGGWECETCGGGGEMRCLECDGDGKTDDNKTCEECSGRGDFKCETCGGTGNETCNYCEGDGEYISDESEYQLYTIACWDKNMNDACEQSEGDLYGAFTYDYFLARFEKYIILNIVNDHRRLNVNLEMDKMYATDYDDNPELTISGQKVLKIFNINNSLISRYTT
jgi:hypothetical protein